MGGWLVTKASVSAGVVGDILKRLGIRNAQENLISVGLVDGVHVGSCWLGAPRLLPRLVGAASTSMCAESEMHPTSGSMRWPVTSSRMIPLRDNTSSSDIDGAWARRAAFVAYADVHGDLSGAALLYPRTRNGCRSDWGGLPDPSRPRSSGTIDRMSIAISLKVCMLRQGAVSAKVTRSH